MQRLEAELGVKLLERTSRSVRTTEAGEVIARYARRILGSVEEARAELDAPWTSWRCAAGFIVPTQTCP